MTPHEVFEDYLALKSHFTSKSYDYFKYNGKMGRAAANFSGRKDVMFFEKAAKHKDPHNLILSNIIVDSKMWIRDIVSSQAAKNNYEAWLKRNQSLTYTVGQDLAKFNDDFDSNFVINESHPRILQLLLEQQVSLETVCCLAALTGALKYWNAKLADDILWADIGTKINKYAPFVNYDKEKIKKVVVDRFQTDK